MGMILVVPCIFNVLYLDTAKLGINGKSDISEKAVTKDEVGIKASNIEADKSVDGTASSGNFGSGGIHESNNVSKRKKKKSGEPPAPKKPHVPVHQHLRNQHRNFDADDDAFADQCK